MKPNAKKEKKFESKMTKSIFLYGMPNNTKLNEIKSQFNIFKLLVNKYIKILYDNTGLLLQLILNDKKDSAVREYQKAIKIEKMNSAYQQIAFDMSFTIISNLFNEILAQLKKDKIYTLTRYKELYAFSLQYSNKNEINSAMELLKQEVLEYFDTLINKVQDVKKKEKLSNQKDKKKNYYNTILEYIKEIDDNSFDIALTELKMYYDSYFMEMKYPNLKKISIPMDSRIMKIEKSNNIKAPYVISFSSLIEKRKKITVPLNTSEHNKHIIEKKDMAKSVNVRIYHNKIQVGWSYEMEKKAFETTKYVGVDIGITDMISTSEDLHFGTFNKIFEFYKNVVEKAFAERANLVNKKRNIKRYLRNHKHLPENIRRSCIRKMSNINRMLQMMNAPYRKNRKYHQDLTKAIKDAVKTYINSIDEKTMTVVELIDIKEQKDKGSQTNSKLSMFARNQLMDKLLNILNERNYNFMVVYPDYTSQICPICGHLDKKNRNGKKFKCVCCGYEGDADYIGAVNIKARATDEEVIKACKENKYSHNARGKVIKGIYERRNSEYIKNHSLLV